MISLIFKILADASGYKRTVEKEVPAASKAAGKKAGTEAGGAFGKEFSQQVKGAVIGAVGAGAIIAAIKKAVTDARETAKVADAGGISVEAAQELQRASEISGLSIEQIKEGFTKAPKETSALMRYVQNEGRPKRTSAEQEQLLAMGEGASGFGAMSSKAIARGASFGQGVLADIASKVAFAVAGAAKAQEGLTGYGTKNTDQLFRAAVMLEGIRDQGYERGMGIAQGTTTTPAGDLIRKLDEIKLTLEKKL